MPQILYEIRSGLSYTTRISPPLPRLLDCERLGELSDATIGVCNDDIVPTL